MSIEINVGDAYWIETPPKGGHPYVVIGSDFKGRYLLAGFTTKKHDLSCVFEPGKDVPHCIQKWSAVNYKRCELWRPEQIKRAVVIESGFPCGSFSEA